MTLDYRCISYSLLLGLTWGEIPLKSVARSWYIVLRMSYVVKPFGSAQGEV